MRSCRSRKSRLGTSHESACRRNSTPTIPSVISTGTNLSSLDLTSRVEHLHARVTSANRASGPRTPWPGEALNPSDALVSLSCSQLLESIHGPDECAFLQLLGTG